MPLLQRALITDADEPRNSSALTKNNIGTLRGYPLALLLLLAAALRTLAALTPGFHHPDAIYQYLEPAHRLLTGDGLVTWEWRAGMRSWLLPTLLAAPMALGRWLDATGDLALLLPRIAAAIASLSIVWAAWSLGDRVSRPASLLAALVGATWFEFVHFGAQTLSEPIATAAFLPAAVLATRDRPGRTALVAVGALLALATLLRPHYAPACAALVLIARWRDLPRSIIPLVAGALAVAAMGAIIDLAQHATPFAWIVENLRQNIVEHRADRYGIAPPFALIAWYLTLWSWWTIPILVGVRFGWRVAPALVVAALINLVVHSLIGHKEYRFVFLTTAALVVVSAIGWGRVLQLAAARWPAHRAAAALAAVVAWSAASLTLANGAPMAKIRGEGRAGSILLAAARHDAATCGVAIVEDATFADIPGTAALRPGTAFTIFAARDPGYPAGDMRRALAQSQSLYNRVVTTGRMAPMLPPGFVSVQCAPWDGTRLCLFARPTSCKPDPASPYGGNAALQRLNF